MTSSQSTAAATGVIGVACLSTFVVNANQVVADQSEYTAVVARRIDLSQAPRLVINTNYGGTDVPVPKGLGPWSASAALTE